MSTQKTKNEKTYTMDSDGSPEMIEYRNKVNSGEITKRGRPFQTAEQRAKAKKKRKEYMATYNARRKGHRPRRKFLDYEEARQRIQAEGIRTVAEYYKWHRMNHPAQMPYQPDDFYKTRGDWINWGHFLGVENQFPYVKKKNFRPYKEAKAYAHSKGFNDVPSWIAYCKAGNVPDDIPHRPDVAYFKTGEWFSWREFLGPQCKIQLGKALEKVNDNVIYILNVPDPRNTKLFRIGVTVGGWSSIDDAVKKLGVKFIDAYVIDKPFDWKAFILKYGEPAWDADGIYQIQNINDLILGLSQFLIRYRRPQ